VTYTTYLSGTGTTHNYMLVGGSDLTGNVYVEGNVVLLVQYPSKIAIGGGGSIRLAPNATLKLYGGCVTAAFNGSGVLNGGLASQFYYFGTDRNTTVSYGGNAGLIGVLYAPNAAITLGGGGSSPIDISGSIVARSIKVTGNFMFHYDEDLRRSGPWR
jgi:hypothetical protein